MVDNDLWKVLQFDDYDWLIDLSMTKFCGCVVFPSFSYIKLVFHSYLISGT